MSTLYTDQATLERVAKPYSARRPVPAQRQPVDHHGLAREWLQCEECIHALRIEDPSRGCFIPWDEAPEYEATYPAAFSRLELDIEVLCSDYRLLLNIYANRIAWRRPYGAYE